jgi:hypothetical protein
VIPRQRKELHRFGKILNRNGRAIRINQTNAIETALEQVLSCKIETFTKIFSALWQQTEIGRQNIGIVRFSTDRGINRDPACDCSGVRPSQTAATNRNRSTCILQKTSVKLRCFLICKRRDKTCLHVPGARRLGHQRQCTTARKLFSRSIRINNAMPPSHSLRC